MSEVDCRIARVDGPLPFGFEVDIDGLGGLVVAPSHRMTVDNIPMENVDALLAACAGLR